MNDLDRLHQAQLDEISGVNEPDPDEVDAKAARRAAILAKPCPKCGGKMGVYNFGFEIACSVGGDNCR